MNPSLLSAVVEALGWTLVHFLWQGCVVAAALWFALKCARHAAPQIRHVAGCVALSLMCAAAIGTFWWQFDLSQIDSASAPQANASNIAVPVPIHPTSVEITSPTIDVPATPVSTPTVMAPAVVGEPTNDRFAAWKIAMARFRPWLPSIVGAWAVGVVWLSLRLLLGWSQIRRLRREGSELEDAVWIERFHRLRHRLNVSRPVRLLCTAAASVPMVIGWFRPVVLVPAGLLTGLSPDQFEAVLAHELAHIRRYDFLVNLVQTVVETFFFYHPATWWVSGQIRAEREHCCDDIASAVCGDTLQYARALSKLEELRLAPMTLSVAANGGSLLSRVRRLANVHPANSRSAWPAALAVLAIIAALSILVAERSISGEQRLKDEKSESAAETSDSNADADDNVSRPHIIIAEHVLLWDDKIVTWDEVVGRLRSLRSRGHIAPTFHFTYGLHQTKDAYHTWKDRVQALFRDEFELASVTFASIGLRGSPRYDAIRTEADLRADAANARVGRIISPDGKPAKAAQVFVLPTKGMSAIEPVALQDAQLLDPFNENWAATGEDGRFTVYPNEEEYLLAVLYSTGSIICKGPAKGENPDIMLEPWATVTLSADKDVADQLVSLIVRPKIRGQIEFPTLEFSFPDTIRIKPEKAGESYPSFAIAELKMIQRPISVKVPAGTVDIERMLHEPGITPIYLRRLNLTLMPGEERELKFPPPNDKERERVMRARRLSSRARETQQSLDQARRMRKDNFTVTVIDKLEKQPIPTFRVLAGVKSGIHAEDKNGKPIGEPVVAWQDHTVRVGRDGIYFWPLEKAYDEMMLRVEADGYQTQMSGWIVKANGPKATVFMMEKDPGVKGQVLQPDGTPAAGAIVARVITRQTVHVEKGRVREFDERVPEKERDKWLRPTMVRADEEGRFQLSSEPDPACAVLVLHDSGVIDLPNVDFQKNPNVTLKAWGRIDGRALWKDKPGVNEHIHMKVYRSYGYPDMIEWGADVRTDANGKFNFDKVPPGQIQLYRPVEAESDEWWNAFHGLVFNFDVAAGRDTPVLVGGQGRKIVGRLTGRDNWDGVVMRLHPNAPHIGFQGDDERWKLFGKFRESPIGPLFFRDGLKPNADGTFEIPNVLPGYYQFFVGAADLDKFAATQVINVEPESPNVAPPEINLGEIKVAPRKDEKSEVKAGPAKPQIIIAKHALIWDGKVMTWDQVLERLRSMRPNGPIFPSFHFTIGRFQSEDGWDAWHKRIMDVNGELFEPAGVGFVTIGPRGSERWDAVRTDADLRPDPSVACHGKILSPDGKPANGAQVAVIPTDGQFPDVGIALEDRHLRDFVDEEWVLTGDDGTFTVSPKGDKYLLAVVHPSGFTVIKGPLTADNSTISVEPWAEVTFQSTGGVDDQSAALSIKPAGADGLCPELMIHYVKVTDKPVTVSVPAGKVFVQRVLEDGSGGGVGQPDQSFILKSGEKHVVTMSPPSDDHRKRAEETRKRSGVSFEKNSSSNDSKQEGQTETQSSDSKGAEPKADEKDKDAAAKSVSIQGKVVDDETGAPVPSVIIQAGNFDPANPSKVTWGFSESRSNSTDGSFSTTVNWADGWTARALADGYVPQPLLKAAPPRDKKTIEIVIRLQRGRVVRGQVLDHAGQPVKGAAIYTIGAISRNLAGGKAYTDWGELDQSATPSFTNDSGRFDIPAGDAKLIAVTCPEFDAWAVPVPEKGDAIIKLPQPARVEVDYKIDGADAKGQVFYQYLSHLKPGLERLQSMRELPIDNGGKLVLPALPPGNYQICRKLMHNLGGFGTSAMLEKEFFEIKPGETRTIKWVRDKGARVKGKVAWPEGEKLGGIIVAIRSERADGKVDKPNPLDDLKDDKSRITYSSCITEKDGTFLTERIPPGRYEIVAMGYAALTPEQLRSTGFITYSSAARAVLTVPEAGETTAPELRMEKVKR